MLLYCISLLKLHMSIHTCLRFTCFIVLNPSANKIPLGWARSYVRFFKNLIPHETAAVAVVSFQIENWLLALGAEKLISNPQTSLPNVALAGGILGVSIQMKFPTLPHLAASTAKTHSPTEPIRQQNSIRTDI